MGQKPKGHSYYVTEFFEVEPVSDALGIHLKSVDAAFSRAEKADGVRLSEWRRAPEVELEMRPQAKAMDAILRAYVAEVVG